MSEISISREEAIEFLTMPKQINCTRDCKYKDNIGACNCKCSDAINKAISDMEKLDKIEKIIDYVDTNKEKLFDDELAENLFEIVHIVKEV